MGVTALDINLGVVRVFSFSSGVPAVVTGSSGDCVHVDASSAPCGGASTALQGLGTITTPPTIDGGSTLTTKTIGATLGASVACGTLQNFTSGEFLLLSLTQDGTGLWAFTCAGMIGLGDTSAIPANKNVKQIFVAVNSSTLLAYSPIWCTDCTPQLSVTSRASGLAGRKQRFKLRRLAGGTQTVPKAATGSVGIITGTPANNDCGKICREWFHLYDSFFGRPMRRLWSRRRPGPNRPKRPFRFPQRPSHYLGLRAPCNRHSCR